MMAITIIIVSLPWFLGNHPYDIVITITTIVRILLLYNKNDGDCDH